VAVFFYGGSWDSGRRQDYAWVGRALAAQGFLTIVPDYRLYPAVRYPGFVEDGALAVRWAVDHARSWAAIRADRAGRPLGRRLHRRHAGAGPDRYLKAAGVDPKVVRAFAGLSGPYDFLPLDGPVTRRTFGEPPTCRPPSPARTPAPTARRPSWPRATATPRSSRATPGLAAALRAKGAAVEERHYEGLNHADTVLALSRPFRGKAPVLSEPT
jgi:acetyl esterase/lipase